MRIIEVIATGIMACTYASDVALAFPFQVKNGYPGCGACHVAPGGGGALTGYGRMTVPDKMATWAARHEEEPLHGITRGNWPEWLMVGGDVRYINVTQKAPGLERHVKFFMQRDVELALQLNEHITVGGSAGIYGPDEGTGEEVEFRKHYLKLGITPNVGVRLGRFPVAYGVAEPDHTLPTRKGLGQGSEVYAGEAAVTTRWGELIATAVAGSETTIKATDKKGYEAGDGYPKGFAARAAAYFLGKGQAGVSGLRYDLGEGIYRTAGSAHVQTGITGSTYLLAEVGRIKETGSEAETVAMTRLGWEFLKGVHLLQTYEMEGDSHSPGIGLQWFPRPHWEVSAQAKRTLHDGDFVDSGILQFHYYL